ncbi:MAG: hypothetical protein KGK30_01675, partial [Elusimicrobia bacterium]|nr:hypothetical protein [Elusimicrobiota bacterium]
MKPLLLPLLACPACRGELRFSALEELPQDEKREISEGRLACQRCGAEYPLEAGVPRLGAALGLKARRTRDDFAFEWKRYPGSLPEDEAVLLAESQLPAEAFRGKRVLDAGCGMGRYSVVALSLGAEVVALDL